MSKIFEMFTGEFVILTLTKNRRQSIEHGGTLKVIEAPTEIAGFLTEEDDEYFYLGFEPNKVQIAVHKTQVTTIEITDPNETQDTLLTEMLNDIPENKDGMN